MTKLTALEQIADKCTTSARAAANYERQPVSMKSYREGQAAAYNDAHQIMKAELKRLRNMWQNGMIITASDFDIKD